MQETKLSICSSASVLIGGSPIQSFEEETVESIVAQSIYDNVYENLLSFRDWSFAKKYLDLTKMNKTPKSGFSSVFLIPNEVLHVISADTSYDLIGSNELHCSSDKVRAYVLVKPREEQLPAHFLLALKYLLASELAVPVTENTTKAQWYESKAQQQIGRCVEIDFSQDVDTNFDVSGGIDDAWSNIFTG